MDAESRLQVRRTDCFDGRTAKNGQQNSLDVKCLDISETACFAIEIERDDFKQQYLNRNLLITVNIGLLMTDRINTKEDAITSIRI